uniref:COMM domain-containing protein 10 isoform X2 n=1 Tax=Myxine glutinosa TaxID=7769 RepID=UPI00358EA024
MGFITETPRIKEAVGIANGVDEGKFPRILSRILQKLHLKNERAFSVEEEQKLQIALDLSPSHLGLLLETLAFLFEQAAFHGPKMPALEQQLLDLGLAAPQIAAFVQAWVGGGRIATEALRRRALAPHSVQCRRGSPPNDRTHYLLVHSHGRIGPRIEEEVLQIHQPAH